MKKEKDIKLIGVNIYGTVTNYKNIASFEVVDGKLKAISIDGKIFRPEKKNK